MKPLLLIAVVAGFFAKSASAGQGITADDLYAQRAELDKSTVRAVFEWHYNFESSDAHVWMPDGTVRNLAVGFDGARLSESSPAEWKKVEVANRDYWKKLDRAARKKKVIPSDIWLMIDADVEVSLPQPQKDKDVIVLRPELFLKVVAIYSVRKPEANKRPDGTSAKAPPSNPSQGAAVPHP